MIPAALCVLYALLAVRAIAVHDGKNHVPLKVLDGRHERGSTNSLGTIEWLTPHFAHRVPSLRKGGWSADRGTKGGCVKGGTYAILRHIVCESVGKGYGRWKRKWMEGRAGGGRGDKTGLYTHVAKLPTEFIEGRGSGPSDDGKKKRWMDGMSLPVSLSPSFLIFFDFFFVFFSILLCS